MLSAILLLTITALALLLLGLARPRWAFMRARWQVLVVYTLAVMLIPTIGALVIPDEALQTAREVTADAAAPGTPPQAASTEQGPEWTAELRDRWCAALKEKQAISAALTAEGVGANPNEALQPGDTVVLKEKSVLNPAPPRDGRTLEEMLDDIAGLIQVPPGATLEIVDRESDAPTGLTYMARWVERDVTGRVDPVTLSWMNTMEAMSQQVEAREAAFQRRWYPVLIDAFGSLDAANTVEALALDHGIYATCD
ncbi:hypothetical protein [Roseospira navarrensis]|uniref:Uncharacterized protein n=1 Tax=Roseospira navarrensis TaxID=140058 RepID=A0A7X1ZFZ8_9PROT|nr:hypothetical protein [Roseospira navarrensis]MQX37859.1 hypothetical protein [Roseospira navarrensis]